MSATKRCHAGLLIGQECVTSDWRRVCLNCRCQESIYLPVTRCRLLREPVGDFHPTRTFFAAWTVNGITIGNVKRLFLTDPPDAVIVVFASEGSLNQAEAILTAGQLQQPSPEMMAVRFCESSKSMCPVVNFVASSRGSSICAFHKTKRPRTIGAIDSAPTAHCACDRICDGANATAFSNVAQLSSCLTLDRLTEHINRDDGSEAWLDSITHGANEALVNEALHDESLGILEAVSSTSGLATNGRTGSSADDDLLFVRGTLHAAGETLKSTGSSMWTVVSDKRLKDVLGDFTLANGELGLLRPRVFRYNGLGGTDASGREFVGLIAQEVPASLAPYCRLRGQARLHPEDTDDTEIFMLDSTCLPYLCINSIKEHQSTLTELTVAHKKAIHDIKSVQTSLRADLARQDAQLQAIDRKDCSVTSSTASQPTVAMAFRVKDEKKRRQPLLMLMVSLLGLLMITAAVATAVVVSARGQQAATTYATPADAQSPSPPSLPAVTPPFISSESLLLQPPPSLSPPSPPPPSPPFAVFPPRWLNEQRRSLGFPQCPACTGGGQNSVALSGVCECCNDGSMPSVSYRLGYTNWTHEDDRFRASILGSNGYYRLDDATCDYRSAESASACIGAGCDGVHGCAATVGYSSGAGMFCFVYECAAPALGNAGCSFVVALDPSFAQGPSPPPPFPP